MRRGALAGAVAALIVLAGCNSSISGSAARAPGVSQSASRTIGSPSVPTDTSSSSSSSTSSTSSSSSSGPTTSSGPPTTTHPWTAHAQSHEYPDGLRAVSPDGGVYAAVVKDKLCINNWADVTVSCPLEVGGLDTVDAAFSPKGRQLGVVLSKSGDSTVWIIDMTTGLARVLGPGGLTPDGTAAAVLKVSAEVWDVDEQTLLVQTESAAGADTADLIGVPVDGSTPGSIPIRADIADSFPSLSATSSGVLYSPNTGPATGQLWWLNSSGSLSQVGSGSFSDGGTVILLAVSPIGESALICPAHGAQIGELAQVDLTSGEVTDYLKDAKCDGAAYSPDGKFVVVAGPVNDDNVLTVFDNYSPEVMASIRLDGTPQNTPGFVTWNSDSLLTVVPADGTAAGARVNVVQLVTG